MISVPVKPKIYHITHIDNLPLIVEHKSLWSDARCLAGGVNSTIVGMSSIKHRRLEELEVTCHPGTKVGDYVPFYFCPRSIMLYILHMGNHPGLTYHGGQQPIVHLQADMLEVVKWAEAEGRRWAYTDRNAGAYLTGFFKRMGDLKNVDWAAVRATDFRDPVIKEGKQAEFLVRDLCPWELIERIGVIDARRQATVKQTLETAGHKPLVCVERTWYY